MSKSLFNGRTLCVITGASRGIGRCIAELVAKLLPENSMLLLLARNTDQLKEVAEKVNSIKDGVHAAFEKFDQGNLNECCHDNVLSILKKAKVNLADYETAIIFHNAGVLGDLQKFGWEHLERKMVETTMNINVTGAILLNAALLTEVRKNNLSTCVIVNVSSLAALQPFPSNSLYCSGKAARNMFFKTLAKEDPSLRVLNWGPGPVDTDMQKQTVQCADPTMRKMFQDLKANNKLLTCEESAGKLLSVLEKNVFESGDHIDFYDV